jgi:hypothetical protein
MPGIREGIRNNKGATSPPTLSPGRTIVRPGFYLTPRPLLEKRRGGSSSKEVNVSVSVKTRNKYPVPNFIRNHVIKSYIMNSIIINPKDKKEFEFVSELLRKLGIDVKVLSVEEKEDLGLAIFMKDVDQTDLASEEEIMSKLRK